MAESTLHRAAKLFNGKYTIKNRTEGTHRTLDISTQPADAKFAPGERVVALLTGPDNTSDYKGFGFVSDQGIHVWKSKRSTNGMRTEWEWYAEILWSLALDGGFSPYADRYEILTEGRCLRCNRTLTTPESIMSGIGPICAEKVS